MKTNDKTLADVQPGGRVRLWDGPLQKAYDDLRFYVDASQLELEERGISREDALDIARESEAALSAQTSTGGQVDALPPLPPKDVVDTHLPTGVRIYGYTAEQMQDYARAALSARQPVGEPVGEVFWDNETGEISVNWLNGDLPPGIGTLLYDTPPAQAVDLGAVRDIARKAFSAALPGSEVDAELRKLLALIDSLAVGNG